MPTLAQTSASRAKQLPKSLPNDAEMINGLLAVAHTARESLGADAVDVAHYRPTKNVATNNLVIVVKGWGMVDGKAVKLDE